jgi:hypothetical protein
MRLNSWLYCTYKNNVIRVSPRHQHIQFKAGVHQGANHQEMRVSTRMITFCVKKEPTKRVLFSAFYTVNSIYKGTIEKVSFYHVKTLHWHMPVKLVRRH